MEHFILADEARKISAKNFVEVSNIDTDLLNIILQDIEIKIKKASEKGEYDILHIDSRLSLYMMDFIGMYLRKIGYEVTCFRGLTKSIGIKWLHKLK